MIVGDDCSLPGIGLAGRRGIAGTVFVHKASLLLQDTTALACPYSPGCARPVAGSFINTCCGSLSLLLKVEKTSSSEMKHGIAQIAGAAAAAGLPLEEVRAVADEAARSTGSMGVATQICRIPGENPPRGCAATLA